MYAFKKYLLGEKKNQHTKYLLSDFSMPVLSQTPGDKHRTGRQAGTASALQGHGQLNQ